MGVPHSRCFALTVDSPYKVQGHGSHPDPGWRFVPVQNDPDETLDAIRSNGRHPFALHLEHRIGRIRRWETVHEDSWHPLASFIAQLPGLTDVVYNCASTVPLCILSVLRQHQCRLHVNTFRVPALSETLSAEFMQLVTSPCLYSVRAAYLPTDANLAVPGTESYYDEDALMRLVAGLTPNLKKMTIVRKAGGTIPVGTQMPPWTGFRVVGAVLPAFARGSLWKLALLHETIIGLGNIEAWSRHTDFRALAVLKLSAPTSTEALDFLATMNLSSLKTLWIVVHKNITRTDDTFEATNRLLLAIPPLFELRLERAVQTLPLAQIVGHHGSVLRNLSLLPSKEHTTYRSAWSEYYVQTWTLLVGLRRCCPQLEYLAISIRRTRGSSAEVEGYRMLGSLPRLSHLDLTLDASDYSVLWSWEASHNDGGRGTRSWPDPPTDSSFDDFDQQIYPQTFIGSGPQARNGHIRHTLINCAIDERLARAIVREILAGRQGSYTRLKSVQIQPVGGGEFTSQVAVPFTLATVIDEISRSWVITCNYDDEKEDKMALREIKTHHSPQMRYGPWSNEGLEEPAMSVFRQVWPDDGEGDWRREWHSYPLSSIP